MENPRYTVAFVDFSHNVVAHLASDSLPIIPRVGEHIQITNGDVFKLCKVVKIEHCIKVTDGYGGSVFIVTVWVDFNVKED